MSADMEILDTPPLSKITLIVIIKVMRYLFFIIEHFQSSPLCDICWVIVCIYVRHLNSKKKNAEPSLNSCNSI